MAPLSVRGPSFEIHTLSCIANVCMASQLPMQDSFSKAAPPDLLCDQYIKHKHIGDDKQAWAATEWGLSAEALLSRIFGPCPYLKCQNAS